MGNTDLYSHNLSLYSRRDPEAAEVVVAADGSNCEFCLNSVGELNLCKMVPEGVEYYHSQNSIAGEVQRWVQTLPSDRPRTSVIFGLGLGYYFDAMRAWLRADERNVVIFIEDDPCVIKRFLETERAFAMLSHRQVIIKLVSPLIGNFSRRFLFECIDLIQGYFDKMPLFASLAYYLESRKAVTAALRTQILFAFNNEQIFFGELVGSRKLVMRNFYTNMLRIAGWPLEASMRGAFKGVPAIICGAGPSVTAALPLVKKSMENAVVFGAGTGMNVLNQNGIFPHFGIGLDPTASQASRIRTNYAYEIPYFIRSRLNREGSHTLHGPKIYVGGISCYGISDWFEEQLGIDPSPSLEPGVSSSNLAMALAAALGCSPIILVGMDLAYTDSSRYPKGIKAHPAEPPAAAKEVAYQPVQQIVVRNVYGEKVNTKFEWLIEADFITDFARTHSDVKLINATQGGYEIEDVEFKPFEAVAEEFLNESYPIEGWIRTLLVQSQINPPITFEKIEQVFVKWREELTAAKEKCHEIKEEIRLRWERCGKGDLNLEGSISERADLLEKELGESAASRHLLKDYKQLFDRLAYHKRRLLTFCPDLFSEEEIAGLKLELALNRVLFFEEQLSFNLALMDVVLREEQVRRSELASSAPKDPPKNQGLKEEALYTISAGRLKICDPELAISIDEPFYGEKKSLGNVDYYLEKGKLHGPAVSSVCNCWYYRGRRAGKSFFFDDKGAVASIQRYREGKREGIQEYYYPDGILRSLIPFSNDELNGTVLLYYPTGALFKEVCFSVGIIDGFEREWLESGHLASEAFYRQGSATGICRRWHSNGLLAQELRYKDESGDFDFFEWDVNGGLINSRLCSPKTAAEKQEKRKKEIIEAVEGFNREAVFIGVLTEEELYKSLE